MTLQTITSTRRFLQLAGEVGKAKKEGDPKKIAEAKAKLEVYKELCLKADKMLFDC